MSGTSEQSRARRHGIRPSAFAFGMVVAALAAGVFCAVAVYIQAMERRATSAVLVHDQLTSTGQARPTAVVLEAVRQMQLVTVEINTKVTALVSHDSWRGDIAARVEAPARLLYGTDLSQLESNAVAYSPATQSYAVRIPTPHRIATEVCVTDEEVDVQVGWLRLRSRAGEYHLGVARRTLYERARELTLEPDDAHRVREVTRAQVEALVRRIVGHDAAIVVVYEDGAGR